MGIVAIAPDEPDCKGQPCSIMNGGCEDVCQLDSKNSIICSCQDGRVLADDKKRCIVANSSYQCNAESFKLVPICMERNMHGI